VTPKEIVARALSLLLGRKEIRVPVWMAQDILEPFIKAAIEDEREACAKICEEGIETARIVQAEGLISIDSVMKTLAERIRARSESKGD